MKYVIQIAKGKIPVTWEDKRIFNDIEEARTFAAKLCGSSLEKSFRECDIEYGGDDTSSKDYVEFWATKESEKWKCRIVAVE